MKKNQEAKSKAKAGFIIIAIFNFFICAYIYYRMIKFGKILCGLIPLLPVTHLFWFSFLMILLGVSISILFFILGKKSLLEVFN